MFIFFLYSFKGSFANLSSSVDSDKTLAKISSMDQIAIYVDATMMTCGVWCETRKRARPWRPSILGTNWMRSHCIKSRVASWRHSRTRSYARVYKYLPTNTHSRAKYFEYARRVKRFNGKLGLRLINFARSPCMRAHP